MLELMIGTRCLNVLYAKKKKRSFLPKNYKELLLEPLVIYYGPVKGFTSVVIPQCCMLCLYVYGFQQYGQLKNSCPLCFQFCSLL